MYSLRRGRPRLPALVDPGADGSALPLWVAHELNVPFDQMRQRLAWGAGGSFIEHQAEGDVVLRSELGPITLIKPSINSELPFILLGRRDFFAGRRVCFHERARRMEIG